MPWVVVAHSPTPSMVRIAASSKGDGRNAEAAWLWWCSAKSSSPSKPSSSWSTFRTFSFSFSQSGIALAKEGSERGKVAR